MEQNQLFNEKQSIRDSAKSLKKYGSTSNHFKRQEVLVKHVVQKFDTLQGIALKYGTSTEQIRRANRLFASDSLFLREHLMIPVTMDSPFYPTESNDLNRITNQISVASPTDTTKLNDISRSSMDRTDMDEFLVKIDTAIATSKKYVAQTQEDSNYLDSSPSETHSPLLSSFRRSASSSCSSIAAAELNNSAAHSSVMTQGRKVRTSLQRLQQQQDEMFEL